MYSIKMMLLMIALALGIAHCAANQSFTEYFDNINTDHKHMAKLPPQCFKPDWNSCNCTFLRSESDRLIVLRWFFDPVYKVCYPIYKLPNKTIGSSILNFSKTRRECESICGYPCVVYYENGSKERGVCMDFSKCDIPIINPVAHLPYPMNTFGLPCPPYKIPCCPPNWEDP